MNIDKNILCMMPWIHAHVWPEGKVFPCCMSDSRVSFGNTNLNTIDEIINNDNFKQLRRQMLDGEKPGVCSRCYELETNASSWTLRKNSIVQFYDKHHKLVESTHADGSIDNFKMRYMDIRFSNLCNMRCRSCGPALSSSWYDDSKALNGDPGHGKFLDVSSNPNFMDELKTHLDYVEEVYFAGGEALITPQHYDVLDYWLATGKTDVRLRYTTNFSVLRFKQRHIFDYWNKFKNVRVAASLDATHERGEYARKGTEWSDIVANRRAMMEACPDIYFEITPTVSIFNIKHLFDFHRTWVEQGLLDINNIRINILTWPQEYSATVLDEQERARVSEIYSRYISWLNTHNARADVINSISGIIEYLNSKDDSNLKSVFKKKTLELDAHRKEDFSTVFPELKDWYER